MADREIDYQVLSRLIEDGEISEALENAASHFHNQGQFDQLFEVRKCLIRHQFGLPVFSTSNAEQLSETQQLQLEEQILDLCREIGTLHFRNRDIPRAWMYLQPLMDRDFVEQLFEEVEVDENNAEELIEIGLGHWAAPVTGYRLLIQTKGTCNAITFFDTQIIYQDPTIRTPLAEVLVEHVYQELFDNVRACVREQSKTEELPPNLEQLVTEQKWIFDNCGHHLDVSHLSSVVRLARYGCNESALDKARQIAVYGSALDDQLKFSGEVPFEDLFDAHRHYFNARLDREMEKSTDYFRTIADRTGSPSAIQTLIEIYQHTGKSEQAIQIAIEDANNSASQSTLDLIKLAKSDSDFEKLTAHFQNTDDPAAYCIAAILKREVSQKKPGKLPGFE